MTTNIISTTEATLDVHELLANRRQIASIWDIEDVQILRPDLTDDQAWEILQAVGSNQDANFGITWEVIACYADHLFGDEPEATTDEEG